MQKVVELARLQEELRAVVDEVARGDTRYVLEQGNQPEAALISYQDYLKFQRWDERERESTQRWAEMRARQAEATSHLTDEEVEAEVSAVVEEVRAERWARKQAERQ